MGLFQASWSLAAAPSVRPKQNTWFHLFHPIKCRKKGVCVEGCTLNNPPFHNATGGHQRWVSALRGRGSKTKGGGGEWGAVSPRKLDGRQLLDHLGKSFLIGRKQWVRLQKEGGGEGAGTEINHSDWCSWWAVSILTVLLPSLQNTIH